MLRIVTDVPIKGGEALARYIKSTIEGKANGCVFAWRTEWRLPPLYQSGVRFRYEPQHGTGNEEFALPPVTYGRKWGDCDDLVIYRICELVAAGERATCRTYWKGQALHVAVRRGDGSVEDPAIMLGAKAL